MTKNKKILLSLSISTPILISSSILISSCSTTYPFVAPSPINLDSYKLNEIQNKLDLYTPRLEEISSEFEGVFKAQNSLLNTLQSYDVLDFGKNLEDVRIKIIPYISDTNQIEYNLNYELLFNPLVKIDFRNNDNFMLSGNKLSTTPVKFNNSTLNSQNDSISLWVTNSQSININSNSYFNLLLKDNSFDIEYSGFKENKIETLKIQKSILDLNNINIYIDKVVNVTTGTKWLNIDQSSSITSNTNKSINCNIKYFNNENPNLPLTKTTETYNNNISFDIIPTKSTMQ